MTFYLIRPFVRVLGLATCLVVSSQAQALLIDVIGDTESARIEDDDKDGLLSGVFVIDDFQVVSTTGRSYPAVGTVEVPELELTSVQISGSKKGSVRVVVYDDGFTADNKPFWDLFLDGEFATSKNNSQSSVSVSAYIDVNNNYESTGILEKNELLATLTGTGSVFDEALLGMTFDGLSAPYGLAIVADVTHKERELTSTFNAALRDPPPGTPSIPEPSIIILMTLGLVGLGCAACGRGTSRDKAQA